MQNLVHIVSKMAAKTLLIDYNHLVTSVGWSPHASDFGFWAFPQINLQWIVMNCGRKWLSGGRKIRSDDKQVWSPSPDQTEVQTPAYLTENLHKLYPKLLTNCYELRLKMFVRRQEDMGWWQAILKSKRLQQLLCSSEVVDVFNTKWAGFREKICWT